MATRKPNIRSAAADLGFLVVAFIAGVAGAGVFVALVVYLLAVIVWWWTRHATLAQLPLRARLVQGAIALLMLAVVLGIFYWLGLALGAFILSASALT